MRLLRRYDLVKEISHAISHAGFRRTLGSFVTSLRTLESARRIGLETQVNTTVTRHNVSDLGLEQASLYQLLQVVSITVLEKTPILRAFQRSVSKVEMPHPPNQLTLLDL